MRRICEKRSRGHGIKEEEERERRREKDRVRKLGMETEAEDGSVKKGIWTWKGGERRAGKRSKGRRDERR